MPASSTIIHPFDHLNASEGEYQALNDFNNRIRAERQPDDPPIPLHEAIQRGRSIRSSFSVYEWTVREWEHGPIIAAADIAVPRTDNLHLAFFGIAVAPEWRRQGITRQLLAPLVDRAQKEERRLLVGTTVNHIPAGGLFMQCLGAQEGSVGHTNQLTLADLDHDLLKSWLTATTALAVDFELGLWIDAFPEEHLTAIAELDTLLSNDQPFDQLEITEISVSPQDLRENERAFLATGTERWTYYLLDRASGHFVGYTEAYWNTNRPAILYQGMTGVLPAYRSRGLGRWLKAAMLDKVLRDRPQVQFIRTGNADSNAPMLKINQALGFNPYIAEVDWQVATGKVAAYLAQRAD